MTTQGKLICENFNPSHAAITITIILNKLYKIELLVAPIRSMVSTWRMPAAMLMAQPMATMVPIRSPRL